jgi:antitoxin ParD1/3/4/toxin ParE1/3/4
MPGSGHRRADLTSRPVLFYRIFSYLVVYQPGSEPLRILGVLRGEPEGAKRLHGDGT